MTCSRGANVPGIDDGVSKKAEGPDEFSVVGPRLGDVGATVYVVYVCEGFRRPVYM